MDSTFPVSDERPEGWFRIDHALLEEYGKDMGPYGIAIYTALAHHVNAQRSCWPSYARLARLTGISRVKVISTIENLERLGVIRKEIRKIEGMDENNTNRYILVPLTAVVPLPRAEVVHTVNHGGKRGEPPQYTTETTLVNDVNHGGKRGEPKQESGNKNHRNKNQEQESDPAPAGAKLVKGVTAPIPVKQMPLPASYPLTEEMRVWAAMEVPALADRIDTEHKKFCNHYRSKAERRADWRPVWETWMMRAVEDFAPPAQKGSPAHGYESKTERNERILRARVARWQTDLAAGDADHQEPLRLPTRSTG